VTNGGPHRIAASDLRDASLAGVAGWHVLPAAIFFATFAWSFVYVSLPFHILRVSTLDEVSTLRWTGWILGISPLVTVVTAPLWGRYAARGNPKRFYVVVETLQGLSFFVMAMARTLPELFLARFLLGIMGAASTFAFIIAGRSGDESTVRRRVAAVQSALTVGQVVGPPAGAIAASRLGFRASFILGGAILLACAALVRWAVPDPAPPRALRGSDRRPRWRDVTLVSLIVLGGSTQIFVLVSILPQVLPPLGVAASRTLEVGAVIVFLSGVGAALGALLAPRLGELGGERHLIAALLVGSSVLLAILAGAASVSSYGALRFLQVLAIAPVFPILVARIAQRAGGEAIGVINAARIGAAFLGPVLATSLLAWTSPAQVHLLLAGLGVACVPLAFLAGAPPKGSRS
jgi:MFS family permease